MQSAVDLERHGGRSFGCMGDAPPPTALSGASRPLALLAGARVIFPRPADQRRRLPRALLPHQVIEVVERIEVFAVEPGTLGDPARRGRTSPRRTISSVTRPAIS